MPAPSTSTSPRACASPLAIRVFVQRADEPPELLLFDQATITIGRPAKSGRRPAIALADRGVSRRHAALHVTARSLVIEDRGGRAGIFLGGEQVRGREEIEPGQRITLAAYTIWIERCAASLAPPPGRRPELTPPSPAPWEPDVGAASWVRAGEPARLLLRGRARTRGRAWLSEHAEVAPEDPRRRWIEASLQRRTSRLRRWGAVALSAAATVGLGVALAGPPLSPPQRRAEPLRCPRAEFAAIESWVEASTSASPAAAALRWAESAGCPSGVRLRIEARLHGALADDGRAPVGTVAGSVVEMTAIAGEDAVIVDETAGGAVRLAMDGEQARFGGASSRWSVSADGRRAAELTPGDRVVLWSTEGTPIEVAEFDAGGAIVAAALDPRGERLWVVAGGRLRGWARGERGWTALEEREELIGITAEDRVEVGAGGLIVGRRDALWWQPLDGGRAAPRHLGRVDAWILAEDGAALLTLSGGELRRWQLRRGRLRSGVVVTLDGALRAWAAIPGGSTIAVASGDGLRLLDTRQRWRRGEPLARALDLEGRAVDELSVDPEGRWLLASDASGALRWRIDGVNAVEVGAPLQWQERPELRALAGHDLVVSRGARVDRWSLVGEAGSDGAVVDHGGSVTAVALEAEGRWLATVGAGVVRIWRREGAVSWRRTATLEVSEASASSPAVAFLRGRDGPLLAVARGRHVDVYDLGEDGPALSSSSSHGRPVVELRPVDGSGAFVGLDAQGGAALWSFDPGSGSLSRRRTWALDSVATAFAAEPGGQRLLLGDASGGLHRVDVERRRDAENIAGLRALPGHRQGVRAIAVSEDGRRVATSGDDGRIRVLNLDDESTLRTFEAAGVRSLAFLGGGAWLVARGEDGVIWAYSTATGEASALGRRSGPPEGLVALADGRLAVRSDRGVEIWALELRGARPRVMAAMDLARDGAGPLAAWSIERRTGTLVTAEPEGIVRVRPLAAEGLIALACALEPEEPDARAPEDSSHGLLAGVSLVDPCASRERSERSVFSG
ncbi:MAG: FHA domain-containing protein [Myxococcales bacterium]|nr:FHA domain-containing protein [Myxococcales bacterium]